MIEGLQRGWRLYATARGWQGRTVGDCAFQAIGWRTLRITKDMVGMSIAQFAAVETRSQGGVALTPEEINFARQVREAGGFAGVAQLVGGKVVVGEIGEE
jgi:hypothetical protein